MYSNVFSRRTLLFTGMASFSLAACGVAGSDGDRSGNPISVGNASENTKQGAWTNPIVEYVSGDKFMGSPDAKVTLVEYASLTCPACARFHATVFPTIKQEYIDTGKINFVFRDFPTPPANIAIAGFAVARCKGDRVSYFEVVDDFFEHQSGILSAHGRGYAKGAILEIAKRNGISETRFEECIRDPNKRREIKHIVEYGQNKNVNSTPTFVLNGKRLDRADRWYEVSGLSAAIEKELRLMNPTENAN